MSSRTAVAVSLVLASAAVRAAAEDLPPVQSVAVGDFNGDGKPDVAVGLPEVNAGKFKKAGEVRMYSGVDGKFLRKISGILAEQSYGDSIAAVGDIDGDGATDLAIAAPSGDGDPYIDFVSGRTGKVLSSRYKQGALQWGNKLAAMGDGSGKARVDLLVRSIQDNEWLVYRTDKEATAGSVKDEGGYMSDAAPVGDVDGDGKADVALCHWSSDAKGKKGAGMVLVYSGEILMSAKADKTILTLEGQHESASVGLSVAAAGDWNGDGKGDLLAGVAAEDEKKGSGQAIVFSGADGTELWKGVGAGATWNAPTVALIGDADGDGKPDVAVGAPGSTAAAGTVSVLSSKDSAVIWTVKGAAKEGLSDQMFPFADFDGDGVADLLVTAPGAAIKNAKGSGYVRILSGKTGAVLLLVNPLLAK